MELHQLRYFVAAAEAGSVSRAAERCGIAQPSLSQQIRKLEASLGVALFDRVGRGVALTDAGRAMLPRAKRILGEVREAESNVRRESEEGVGAVAIGAIPTMAPYLLPSALGRFRRERPESEVLIHEGFTEQVIDALVDNIVDVAIVSTPLAHELIQTEVIGEEELLVAVAAEHPLAKRERAAWSDLQGEPTVTLREMHCLGKQIEGFCSARGMAARVVCRTSQLSTVFELVGLGLGLSIVPEMAAAHQGGAKWRYVRLGSHRPRRQIAVAWRKDRTRARGAVRLAEIVAEELRAGQHRLGSGA